MTFERAQVIIEISKGVEHDVTGIRLWLYYYLVMVVLKGVVDWGDTFGDYESTIVVASCL